jgi:ABC-type sugar transport system substrate-binding protein
MAGGDQARTGDRLEAAASTNQHFFDAFRQGMREHGYVDGQNVIFVERWAEGRSERFPELIEELISLKANVILAVSAPAALAAKTATTTIPIVFIASDPLGANFQSITPEIAFNVPAHCACSLPEQGMTPPDKRTFSINSI